MTVLLGISIREVNKMLVAFPMHVICMRSFISVSVISVIIVTISFGVVLDSPVVIFVLSVAILSWFPHLPWVQASVFKTPPVVEANILGEFVPHIFIEEVPLIAFFILTYSEVVIFCTLYTL